MGKNGACKIAYRTWVVKKDRPRIKGFPLLVLYPFLFYGSYTGHMNNNGVVRTTVAFFLVNRIEDQKRGFVFGFQLSLWQKQALINICHIIIR